MKSSLSDKLNGGDIKVKKKKVKKSPLSDKYKRFLNNENINLNKKEKPTLDEIKINVIKKDPEKKPCKRKRVRIKDGKLNNNKFIFLVDLKILLKYHPLLKPKGYGE